MVSGKIKTITQEAQASISSLKKNKWLMPSPYAIIVDSRISINPETEILPHPLLGQVWFATKSKGGPAKVAL
jgi:hypothetical protein